MPPIDDHQELDSLGPTKVGQGIERRSPRPSVKEDVVNQHHHPVADRLGRGWSQS